MNAFQGPASDKSKRLRRQTAKIPMINQQNCIDLLSAHRILKIDTKGTVEGPENDTCFVSLAGIGSSLAGNLQSHSLEPIVPDGWEAVTIGDALSNPKEEFVAAIDGRIVRDDFGASDP